MKQVNLENLFLNQLSIPVKLLESYKHLGIDETDVMVLLQLHKSLWQHNRFPTPAELSDSLTINEKACSMILRKLIQKGLLMMQQSENDQHQITEAYSLEPLWEKLLTQPKEVEKAETVDGAIFLLFEQEFGRPLSPFEIDMMNTWIDVDEMDASVIKAALRESVLMSKRNFKYIDRILREWKQKGVRSVEQAREVSKAFHNQKGSKQSSGPKRDTSFYYNWLEEGE